MTRIFNKIIGIFFLETVETPHTENEIGKNAIKDDLRKTSSVLENIHFYLNSLKRSQTVFDQFKAVVEKDLIVKMKSLEATRFHIQTGSNKRVFVNVQLMMMKCYLSRVKSFQKVSDKSIINICKEYSKDEKDDEKIGEIVSSHVHTLVKMKRRMK